MDTGEFVALDVIDTELRAKANINHRRAEELAEALWNVSKRVHATYHKEHGEFESCPMYTCMYVRRELGV